MASSRIVGVVLCAGLCAFAAQAAGQPATAPPSDAPPAAAAPVPTPLPAAASHLTAGTPVEVEITQTVSSKTGIAGATFSLRLAKPILLDGKVVAPAGLTGAGEVVDAHRSGMGGRPGELILAARFVDDGGVRIPLRALKFGMTGHDNGNTAMAVAAAGVVVPGAGIVSMFITGGEVVIPAGTRANAKLGADIDVASLPAAAPPPEPPAPAAVTPAVAPVSSPPPQQGPTQ